MAKINETAVKELPIPPKGHKLHFFPGAVVQGSPTPRGFAVRVTANGVRSFMLCYWHGGRERRYTIGRWPDWSCLQAVKEARELRQRVDRGEDIMASRDTARAPVAPPEKPTTVADVVARFVEQHVEKTMRRPESYVSPFRRLVVPAIGSTPIYELRRSHIADLLDKVAGENGAVMADRCLTAIGSCLRWYADRDEKFTVPRLTKLKRASGVKFARQRILNDDEIRVVWEAAGECGNFGQLCRFSLLTAARRGEVAAMTWNELVEGGTIWEVPAERYKTEQSHAVPLSLAAMALLDGMPHVGDLVLPSSSDPRTQISRGGSNKEAIDKKLAGKVAGWTVHDLRRTARSLMSRAGVPGEIAERVLGHVVGNTVGRTYDRHSYINEKRAALERLAQEIDGIINPQPANVVPLRAG